MKTTKQLIIILISLIILTGCGEFSEKIQQLQENANKQFGDQHFKTAIAFIELHKIRTGQYPESMDSIKYTGEWDILIKMSVRYEKVDSGYNLDLINGWIGRPKSLKYPDDFWKGLGLRKSNLKN